MTARDPLEGLEPVVERLEDEVEELGFQLAKRDAEIARLRGALEERARQHDAALDDLARAEERLERRRIQYEREIADTLNRLQQAHEERDAAREALRRACEHGEALFDALERIHKLEFTAADWDRIYACTTKCKAYPDIFEELRVKGGIDG